MTNSLAIDTGEERNVVGHLVSGAVASAVVAGAINYEKVQKNEITQGELLTNTARLTAQGAIATASAISTANYIGKGNWLGAFASFGVGVAGVYATQKLYDKIETKTITQEVL